MRLALVRGFGGVECKQKASGEKEGEDSPPHLSLFPPPPTTTTIILPPPAAPKRQVGSTDQPLQACVNSIKCVSGIDALETTQLDLE